MDAIILAGGLGTRLKKTVPDRPKPLALVGDEPFLSYLLETLRHSPITRVILAVGYRANQIIDFFNANPPPLPVVYSIENQPLGTGGALKLASQQVDGDTFLVFNGDCFCEIDLEAFVQTCPTASLVMGYRSSEDSKRYGGLQLDEENGIISSFAEKGGHAKHINVGIYRMKKSLLSDMPETPFSLEQDFFPTLTSIQGFETNGKFIDIGTAESYEKAQTYLTRSQR